jgi:hypothetical protein
MKSTRTYFKQIPVAAVKKLVEEFPSHKETSQNQADDIETHRKTTAPLQVPAHLHCRKRIQ